MKLTAEIICREDDINNAVAVVEKPLLNVWAELRIKPAEPPPIFN